MINYTIEKHNHILINVSNKNIDIDLNDLENFIETRDYSFGIFVKNNYFTELVDEKYDFNIKKLKLEDLKFKIKFSDCKNYFVIYTDKFTDAWFFKNDKLFKHRRASGYNRIGDKLLIDFINYNNKLCYFWQYSKYGFENKNESGFGLFDIETDELIKSFDFGEFLCDYKFSPNKKYMYVYYWVFGPFPYVRVFDIESDKGITFALNGNVNDIIYENLTNDTIDVVFYDSYNKTTIKKETTSYEKLFNDEIYQDYLVEYIYPIKIRIAHCTSFNLNIFIEKNI